MTSQTSEYFPDFRIFPGLPDISRTSGTSKLNIRHFFMRHSATFVKPLIWLLVLKPYITQLKVSCWVQKWARATREQLSATLSYSSVAFSRSLCGLRKENFPLFAMKITTKCLSCPFTLSWAAPRAIPEIISKDQISIWHRARWSWKSQCRVARTLLVKYAELASFSAQSLNAEVLPHLVQ